MDRTHVATTRLDIALLDTKRHDVSVPTTLLVRVQR